jgi:hypothetical protein
MKCAIGGEADILATQRFFVQGRHSQGDRHLNASRTRFIPEKPAKGQSWISVRAGGDVAIEPSAA